MRRDEARSSIFDMPTRLLLLAVVAFVLTHPGVDGTLDVPTQLYPDRLISSNSLLGAYIAAPSLLTGPLPKTARQVFLACLHSVAPFPYLYKMRCPDTATVYDWFDKFGAYHRRTEHAPVPGVTKQMAKWFVSPYLPLLSPAVNCMGRKVDYWYKCWHPLDHIALIPWPGISPDHPKLPALFARVWEHYRRLPNETVDEFELNMPVQIMDPNINVQIKAPFPIPGVGPGLVIGAFNAFYEDTSEGLKVRLSLMLLAKVTTELIVGSDQPGINLALNVLSDAVIRSQFFGLSDQVTRHSIEEWGNLEHFLPDLYAQYHPAGGIFG